MLLPQTLYQALADACQGLTLPRVRALHLPPAPWNGRKDGEFAALALDDGSVGLSYVLLDDTLAALARGDAGQGVAGSDPLALARDWVHARGARRTVGFAAVNALTRHLFDRAGFIPAPAEDSIGGLDPQPADHIGMVGLFPPLVKRVTHSGARLTVIERRSDLVRSGPSFSCTTDPQALADCNKVLVTSTVLLNDTLDTVLAQCRSARRVVLIGPGASCLPDPLFARGIHLLGGTWVLDGPALCAALARGEPWGACTRKFSLDAADYPGMAALRDRWPAPR